MSTVSSLSPGYLPVQSVEQPENSAGTKENTLPPEKPPADLNILQKHQQSRRKYLNLHAIWTAVSRYSPPRPTQQDYRAKMVEAYITTSHAANRSPAKVKTSLWTDMGSNISALLKPVVRANGSELEIPHSMIGKSRLQVRRLSELEAMINKVEDDDVRIMLQKIYDPPLTENVGLRSDLLRHLCGMLDRGKLNVYIDIDDLTRALTSEVLQLEKYQHLSDTDIGNMSESDRARLLIDAIGSSQLNEKQRTKNIPITPLILHQGHITMGLENSIQGQVPGHRRGIKVARHMLLAMNSGVYTGERPNVLELRAETPIYRKTYRDALNIISELTQLSGNTPNEKMDNDYYTAYIAKLSTMEGINSVEVNQHLIDHFRLAESVRQIVSELQHDIDQLAAQVNAGEMGDDETTQTLKKIAGRAMIFNHCMHIITGLVNVSTYLSQVSSNSKLKGKKGDLPIVGFYRLFKQVSGADPFKAQPIAGTV